MFDNHTAYPIGRTIDHGIHLEADVFDDDHGRFEQVDLDAAELVDAAAWAILVADTHDDALDAVAVARQHKLQPRG